MRRLVILAALALLLASINAWHIPFISKEKDENHGDGKLNKRKLSESDVPDAAFKKWKEGSKKVYSSEKDEQRRRLIYKRNLAAAKNHEHDYEEKNPDAPKVDLSLEKFADMTPDEFREKYATGLSADADIVDTVIEDPEDVDTHVSIDEDIDSIIDNLDRFDDMTPEERKKYWDEKHKRWKKRIDHWHDKLKEKADKGELDDLHDYWQRMHDAWIEKHQEWKSQHEGNHTGEDIDEEPGALKKIRDKIKEIRQKVQEGFDDTKESAGDAWDAAKEKIHEGGEAVKDAVMPAEDHPARATTPTPAPVADHTPVTTDPVDFAHANDPEGRIVDENPYGETVIPPPSELASKWEYKRGSGESVEELEERRLRGLRGDHGKRHHGSHHHESHKADACDDDNKYWHLTLKTGKSDKPEGKRCLRGAQLPDIPTHEGRRRHYLSHSRLLQLPESVDWSAAGAVTDVRHQGTCNSCWAIATTEAVEGLTFIKKGELPKLSAQQVLDCSGAGSCEAGGYITTSFKYLNEAGVCLDHEKPYAARIEGCSYCTPHIPSRTTSYVTVEPNQHALEAAVAQQPVVVQINAVEPFWQFYKGGIVTEPCSAQHTHAALLVGYGVENGVPYWKIKNCWGSDWGEGGYIRLGRGPQFGDAGQCGLQLKARYPVME